MDNQLKAFSLQFFRELGASVSDSGDYLEVKDVPPKFQKFYGKNEPYKLVFDKSISGELVAPESYLLKMMRAYLDNSGDAVLTSLNYKLHVDSFIKDNLKLLNCSVVKATANTTHNFMFKFTFQTTYKYLNEEEKLINELYVDEGLVVNPDLSKFTVSNTNKKDIEITELRDYYSTAKENIKGLVNERTSKIASVLDVSLSKEINRINIYHDQQVKEIDEQIAKVNAGSLKSKDPIELERQKIQFVAERDLFVQNEQKKHALRLNTKLITTTIIDYPVYSIETFFKSENVTRLVVIKFDPLKNKIDLPLCDLCKNSLNEIIICNGNHLVCRNCGARCEDCNQISCETCLRNICSVTKRKICRQCGRVCVKCKAFKNKRFMDADAGGRGFICKNCY
ncbi:MAG: hypothetical protein AABX23_01785 [Nanoarchaeota archaeon]